MSTTTDHTAKCRWRTTRNGSPPPSRGSTPTTRRTPWLLLPIALGIRTLLRSEVT